MEVVRRNVVNPRPESVLSIALNDFRSILTDEQQVQFAATSTPDASAAVKLATEIDRKNTSRTGRCLGVRLLSFLESVNQFSNVVDTFVSSNPQVAGLRWGGVKLTLLVVNNFATYFDKLSNLLCKLDGPALVSLSLALYISLPRGSRELYVNTIL